MPPGTGAVCQCGHETDPHRIVALNFEAVAGAGGVPVDGVMLCPECDCVLTWSVEGRPAPEPLTPEELERVRKEVFG